MAKEIICKRCGDEVRPELTQPLDDVDFCLGCAVAVHHLKIMAGLGIFVKYDTPDPGPTFQTRYVEARAAVPEDILDGGGSEWL